VPPPLAQALGEFDHSRLVAEDGLRVPPREQRRVAVQHHCNRNAGRGDAGLDDVALQEVLPDEGKPFAAVSTDLE
jgi:hypothetical protein